MARTSYILIGKWYCTRPTRLKLGVCNARSPLEHIIFILSQSDFTPTPWCCVINGITINTNVMYIGFTILGLELSIYSTYHYTTLAVTWKRGQIIDDTKCVINIRKSKKDVQYNRQKKTDKRTNNNLQNTTLKNKDWAPRTSLIPGWTQVLRKG